MNRRQERVAAWKAAEAAREEARIAKKQRELTALREWLGPMTETEFRAQIMYAVMEIERSAVQPAYVSTAERFR